MKKVLLRSAQKNKAIPLFFRQNFFYDSEMNKIMLHSARDNESKLKDLAILSCQSIQEKLLDQETKDLKKARLHLYATEEYLTQMLWMARMLSEEGALSGFVYTAIFVVLGNICRQMQSLEIQLGRTGLDSANLARVFESKLCRQKPV